MTLANEKITDNIISEIVKTLISIIEEKDEFIKGHSERVASRCVRFWTYLGLPKERTNQIYLAGLLHDIGMVNVPLTIIHKTSELSEEEWEKIKKHPEISEKILSHLSFMKGTLSIIRHHHEAWDGSGYPDGLRGEEIPLESRILCLMDSYDAMTSPRAYRSALSEEEAFESLQKAAGHKFDEDLVRKYLNYLQPSSENPQESEQKNIPGTEAKTLTEAEEDNKSANDAGKSVDKKILQDSISKIVNQVKAGNIDLPVLPKVIQEIQKVMSRSSANVDDLAEAIEKDAVISVKVISAANSPFYRGTEKVKTVDMAISRLGFKETQSIVVAIANKSLYETKNARFKKLMETLWLHSLATAYSAKAISKAIMTGDIDKYFLMGLVHDIGKALLLKVLGDIHPQVQSLEIDEILTAIQDIHTGFGGAILRRWGFTEEYIRVSLLHEGPEFSENTDKHVLVINLGNHLAHNLGFSLSGNGETELAGLDSAKMLGINPEKLNSITEEIKQIMKETANIF